MDDSEGRARVAAFTQALAQLGWTDGGNVQIEYRWGASDADTMWKQAAELVALAPGVMVATGGPSLGPLLQASSAVPIVFANVPDRVGSPTLLKAGRGPAATLPALCNLSII